MSLNFLCLVLPRNNSTRLKLIFLDVSYYYVEGFLGKEKEYWGGLKSLLICQKQTQRISLKLHQVLQTISPFFLSFYASLCAIKLEQPTFLLFSLHRNEWWFRNISFRVFFGSGWNLLILISAYFPFLGEGGERERESLKGSKSH